MKWVQLTNSDGLPAWFNGDLIFCVQGYSGSDCHAYLQGPGTSDNANVGEAVMETVEQVMEKLRG